MSHHLAGSLLCIEYLNRSSTLNKCYCLFVSIFLTYIIIHYYYNSSCNNCILSCAFSLCEGRDSNPKFSPALNVSPLPKA